MLRFERLPEYLGFNKSIRAVASLPASNLRRWQPFKFACTALLVAHVWQAQCHASGGDEFASQTVATSRIQPEPAAFERYRSGHLGILWPSFDREMLMLAYRQTNGLPALSTNDVARYGKQMDRATAADNAAQDDNPIKVWIGARKNAGADDLPFSISAGWRPRSNYSYEANCLPDAFRLANQTLVERQRDHGKETLAIKSWLAGQDAVFSNCYGGKESMPMPPLAANAPLWLKQDRAYQEAAALFYQGKYDEAIAAFDTIARDNTSTWREWADYLSIRSWWRQQFNSAEDYQSYVANVPDWASSQPAQRLRRIETSTQNNSIREAVHGLYASMAARYSPAQAYAEHWKRMENTEAVDNLADWVADERWYWALLPETALQDDWLYQTRSLGNDRKAVAEQSVLQNWRKTGKAVWLASIIMAISPKADEAADVIAASRKAGADNLLYIHYLWHRIRLELAKGDFAAARKELKDNIAIIKQEPLGVRQAFDQLQMLAADSLDEVSLHLVRTVIGTDTLDADNAGSFQPARAADAIAFIDQETTKWLLIRHSAAALLQLAKVEAFPLAVRKQLTGEAWHRAALVGNEKIEHDATALWATLLADAKLTAQIEHAANSRYLMARSLLLKEITRLAEYNSYAPQYTEPENTAYDTEGHWRIKPAYRSADDETSLQAELAQAAKANDTTWMGQQILPYLAANPRFAEGPAILEKLVYASRYGAKDTDTSRRAFKLLHKQYPNSAEAKRTRYYY